MVDYTKKHKKNGMVRKELLLRTGHNIIVNIATGVVGESTCLIVLDRNLYPDTDSRSERHPEHIIPINSVDELKELSKLINIAIRERNKTLKLKKKKL